jgi:hypothetical protein
VPAQGLCKKYIGWQSAYRAGFRYTETVFVRRVDPRGRAVTGVGLQPLAFWDLVRIAQWGVDDRHLWMLFVVRYRSLRWADHFSRGILPSVVCLVWSWNFDNEEALVLDGKMRCYKKKKAWRTQGKLRKLSDSYS